VTEAIDELLELTTLEDVVDNLELTDIVYYEIRGRRRDGFAELLDEIDPDEDARSSWTLGMLNQDLHDSFAVRGQLHAANKNVVVDVDAAVVYSKAQPFAFSEELRTAFIEHVAVMTLFPYLRGAVGDASMRLGAPITVSLIRQGGRLEEVPDPE